MISNEKIRSFLSINNAHYYVYSLVLLLYHKYMNLTLPDDYSYVLREHNIFAWLIERYNTWSSRVGVEFVLAFAAYNQIAFIVMDMIVNVAIMYLIIRLLDIKRLSEKWLVLALLLMYNIHDMSSAGWVATMVNYMWVVAALLIMANILELHFKGSVRNCLLPFSLLIVCFAGSHEQGVIALLIMFLTYIGIDYKCNHHINKDIICFFVLSTLLLLFIVLSPGNQIRTQVATTVPGANPLFFESTIFEKVWLGVLRFHSMYLSPNNHHLAYAFSAVLLSHSLMGDKKKMDVVLASIPLCILVGYYLAFKWSLGNAVFCQPDKPFVIDDGDWCFYAPLICSILFCVSVIAYLFRNFSTKKFVFCASLLLIGIATQILMGFSPTIYISGNRTSIFLYFSFVLLTIILFKSLEEYGGHRKFCKIVSYSMVLLFLTISILDSIDSFLLLAPRGW